MEILLHCPAARRYRSQPGHWSKDRCHCPCSSLSYVWSWAADRLARLKQLSPNLSIQSLPSLAGVSSTLPSVLTLYTFPSSLQDTLLPIIANSHIGNAKSSLVHQATKKAGRKPDTPGPSWYATCSGWAGDARVRERKMDTSRANQPASCRIKKSQAGMPKNRWKANPPRRPHANDSVNGSKIVEALRGV